MGLFSGTFNNLGNALNVLTAKHSVISGNVANIDTPGYKAKELDFKEAFEGALSAAESSHSGMKVANNKHFSGATSTSSPYSYIKEQLKNSIRNDGNNVNIDKEMVGLSENAIMYEIVSQLLAKKFESLKYAISEGRRG